MAAAQVCKGVIGPWRQYSSPFIVVSLALLRFKDGGAVLESNIDSSSRRRRELEVVADVDSEREPPSAAEIFDDLIHASSSEGFTYPSFARCHRAGNVSECQGFRVGSCWSEQIFGSFDLSSNHEVISVGATKKWTQKAQRLKKGGQGFCEGRIQARSWRVLNSYRFDFLSRANPIQECWMQRRPFSSSGVDVRDFIGKGAAAIAEIDRLADHTDPDDHRLKPLLKAAKESFELALEVDKHNTYAMLALARLHLYYEIPGACLLSGAALLETAADAGDADAQYELAVCIRTEGLLLGKGELMDIRAFNYLESAACQKHPGALFLVGAMYLVGNHVNKDPKAAAWCFHKAAEQGHIPAATAYGALITKGANWEDAGNEDTKDDSEYGAIMKNAPERYKEMDPTARAHFEKAAEAGDDLAVEWLTRVPSADHLSP